MEEMGMGLMAEVVMMIGIWVVARVMVIVIVIVVVRRVVMVNWWW